jgi:hypothetical protein
VMTDGQTDRQTDGISIIIKQLTLLNKTCIDLFSSESKPTIESFGREERARGRTFWWGSRGDENSAFIDPGQQTNNCTAFALSPFPSSPQ